jgi:hypothetical protein
MRFPACKHRSLTVAALIGAPASGWGTLKHVKACPTYCQKYSFTPNCTYRGVLLLYSVPKFVAYAVRN